MEKRPSVTKADLPGVSIKKSKKAKFGWEIKGVTLEHALSALGEATKAASYKFGKDIKIALDVASSEFCDKKGQGRQGRRDLYVQRSPLRRLSRAARWSLTTRSSSRSSRSSPLKTASMKGLEGLDRPY